MFEYSIYPNYDAEHFSNMIRWDAEVVTEPPLLRRYSDAEIRAFEREPFVLAIPSNSQHVKRCIQLMASHSTSSSDPAVRDGLCKASILERKRRPTLDRKPI